MKIDVTQLQHLMKDPIFVKAILISEHGVPIIFIIGLNIPCINVLTCTHNFCNLILPVGFNFGANLTIRSSLNRYDQSITV